MKSQILQGNYVAQLYISKDVPPLFHCVITKHGAPEIIRWSQFHTPEECEREARKELDALNGHVTNNLLLFPPLTKSDLLKMKARKKRRPSAKRKRASA